MRIAFQELRETLFPELAEVDYADYLADIREAIKHILPWGGFIALVAWLPFLAVDPRLYPELAGELLVLRLCLSATGLLLLAASLLPLLRRRALGLANLGIFALLALTPIISNLVGNDPRYLSGYLLALVVVALFPVPFTHTLAQITISIVFYFLCARWLDPDLIRAENYYSLANVAIAYSITALMLYINERMRLQRWIQKVNLEKTRIELKARNDAMEFDLHLAQAVQKNLLPDSFPRRGGLDIDGLFVAMEQVGGDFYEVKDLALTGRPDDQYRTIVLIADVSGHGVSAAMVSGMTKLSFQHALDAGLRDPADILTFINRDIIRYLLDEQFLTAFLATIDTATGTFRYANGCHRPAIRVTAEGATDELDADGTMIGMFEEVTFEVRETILSPGSILLFYTDGIVETKNVQRREFGPELLQAKLIELRGLDASGILLGIKSALDQFAGASHREDDLTMLVLRYIPVRGIPEPS